MVVPTHQGTEESIPNQEVELAKRDIRSARWFLCLFLPGSPVPALGLFLLSPGPFQIFHSDLLTLREVLLQRLLLCIQTSFSQKPS